MTRARVIETDVCIIGSGITAAMMAEKLAAERRVKVTVIEAGGPSAPLVQRALRRARWQDYGETPWPRDHVDDLNVLGTAYGFSPSMNVAPSRFPCSVRPRMSVPFTNSRESMVTS